MAAREKITTIAFLDPRAGYSEGRYTFNEMHECFPADEREALEAGKIITRPGGRKMVDATALAKIALGV